MDITADMLTDEGLDAVEALEAPGRRLAASLGGLASLDPMPAMGQVPVRTQDWLVAVTVYLSKE